MSTITEQSIEQGQSRSKAWVVKLYNFWNIHFSNRFIWRCPNQHIINLYNSNITDNHLDIGVGAGYYLKHCKWQPNTLLSLLDINTNNLNIANNKLKHLNPTRYQADIYKPQTFLKGKFNSISITYLLHCLPGDMRAKTSAIKHCSDMLKEGGTLFGATIISNNKHHNSLSKSLINFYNEKGMFSNEFDSVQALAHALNRCLDKVIIETHGCVALFKAIKY